MSRRSVAIFGHVPEEDKREVGSVLFADPSMTTMTARGHKHDEPKSNRAFSMALADQFASASPRASAVGKRAASQKVI